MDAQPPRTTRRTTIAEDTMFLDVLDCNGACIGADQKSRNRRNNNEEGHALELLSCKKHHVFWRAVREIADHKAALEDIISTEENETSSASDFLIDSFPDEIKRSDGCRSISPCHCPTVDSRTGHICLSPNLRPSKHILIGQTS